MKKYIKQNLIFLPRKFRVKFGKVFMSMLGKIGTSEWNEDMVLYNELARWTERNE